MKSTMHYFSSADDGLWFLLCVQNLLELLHYYKIYKIATLTLLNFLQVLAEQNVAIIENRINAQNAASLQSITFNHFLAGQTKRTVIINR